MATASAAEPFSIRGFAVRMRAVDTAKCWPFGGGSDGELEPDPQLPPMDPPPRSRWWEHELAAERARLLVGEAAECGGKGDGLGKGTKRKGSRGSGRAERAKKRRRALQFRFFLKHKEKTSKPQSTSCLLQHVLHKGLLRKRKNATIHTWRELAVRKKLEEQETQDHMSTHENCLNKQRRRGMDPSNDMNSSLFRRKAANSFVIKRSIKVSRSTNYPLNPGCEAVKHVAYPPKDDIFGDLPLLESSKIMFQTGVDELPTVIEDSFGTNQSGPDAISETVPMKLMPASDITAQTSSPLEDLMKKEGNPDKESTCISLNDTGRSHPSSAGFDGPLNHRSINMVKTCLGDIQLKSTDVPALSSYSNEGPKSGSCNPRQGCFYTNSNCCQEIKKPATSSVAVRTRTEATKKDRDAAVNGKKNTDMSGPLVPTGYHLSSEGSVLSSAISQGTVNTGTNTDGMSSCRSMPAWEYVLTPSHFGNFASNVCHENRKSMDTCTSSSMEDQGNWYSKLHPVCTPASIGLAFMRLPGLERMQISSCNLRTCENTFMNGRSMNTVRCQKQQLVSGMTNTMQGQKKIGFRDSQVWKKGLDGYVRQDVYHSHQPTVRLMGKTVSVCKRSKEQKVSTMGNVWTDNSIIKQDHLPSISCHLPEKRLFPCQDSVIPTAHVDEFSDILPRIPNSALSEARSTITDVQNQRLQQINSVSSTIKDRIWNSGSQFVCQTEINKASMVSSNSRSRHLDLHQPPQVTQVINIPQNQHSPLCTPASSMYREDHNFVGPAVNQSSTSFPQWVINTSMQGKYQKSTLLSYDDPSSVPIRQPCQVPGAKLSSTSIISFHDYGTNNAKSRNSYQGVRPSLATSLASNSIATTGPTCVSSLPNIDVRKGSAFVVQRNKRPAYADNVSQQPAKRQLVTDKLDLTTPMVPNMKNLSLGWSLNDAVGPRMLDFSNKIAGHATQISRNENDNLRVSSGPVQVVETKSRALRLVAGATKTMLKLGQNLNSQNLNDHSKLLYSTKFSFDNGINSVVL